MIALAAASRLCHMELRQAAFHTIAVLVSKRSFHPDAFLHPFLLKFMLCCMKVNLDHVRRDLQELSCPLKTR